MNIGYSKMYTVPMLKILTLFLTTVVLTFTWGIIFNHFNQKRSTPFLFRLKSFHFHHSLIGLLLFLLGLLKLNSTLLLVGFGIMVGHGFEEIYFGCHNWRAFLHFITKD